MKKYFYFLIFLFCMAACAKEEQGTVAFKVAEKDLIPEGITYSSSTNSFYLSSINKNKIVAVDPVTGKHVDFISSEVLGYTVLGLVVDEKRKKLWACANGDLNGEHHSTVAKFDLFSGELIKSYSVIDTFMYTNNDLALDRQGNIYYTNGARDQVGFINSQTDSTEIFFEGEEIKDPNGITISPDNKYIYVASTYQGIRIIDTKTGDVVDKPDTNFTSWGIDGLKFYKNSLIGIQNHVRHKRDRKILRFYLNEAGNKIIRQEILDQAHPMFDVPTTFVIVDDTLFCLANSQLLNYANGKIKDESKLSDVIVLRYNL